MLHTTLRRTAFVAAISTSLIGAACGGGDDGESAAAPDIDAVTTCLADAGFDVVREADQDAATVLPEEYKDSVGLLESVQLGPIGDDVGIGAVAFYESASEARDDDEAASAFRTDDVLSGVSGTVAWEYVVTSGDASAVEPTITDCLG